MGKYLLIRSKKIITSMVAALFLCSISADSFALRQLAFDESTRGTGDTYNDDSAEQKLERAMRIWENNKWGRVSPREFLRQYVEADRLVAEAAAAAERGGSVDPARLHAVENLINGAKKTAVRGIFERLTEIERKLENGDYPRFDRHAALQESGSALMDARTVPGGWLTEDLNRELDPRQNNPLGFLIKAVEYHRTTVLSGSASGTQEINPPTYLTREEENRRYVVAMALMSLGLVGPAVKILSDPSIENIDDFLDESGPSFFTFEDCVVTFTKARLDSIDNFRIDRARLAERVNGFSPGIRRCYFGDPASPGLRNSAMYRVADMEQLWGGLTPAILMAAPQIASSVQQPAEIRPVRTDTEEAEIRYIVAMALVLEGEEFYEDAVQVLDGRSIELNKVFEKAKIDFGECLRVYLANRHPAGASRWSTNTDGSPQNIDTFRARRQRLARMLFDINDRAYDQYFGERITGIDDPVMYKVSGRGIKPSNFSDLVKAAKYDPPPLEILPAPYFNPEPLLEELFELWQPCQGALERAI